MRSARISVIYIIRFSKSIFNFGLLDTYVIIRFWDTYLCDLKSYLCEVLYPEFVIGDELLLQYFGSYHVLGA